ncbi:MAG: VirE protein, partial [Bacteroidia bacterium]|nr:VirE protein [Bacteroidia bacterium]
MERIDKQAVLHRTHYGIGIYSHILRECFPEDEVVMRLSGRDCGLCRNPFAEGASTLHIFIEKSDPANAMSAEYAKHTTTDHSIPDGDAFAFAELHYHQSGKELLATLNRELNLHIGDKSEWYNKPTVVKPLVPESVVSPLFSFFSSPITNTKPSKNFTLLDAYHYIIGDTAKERTQKLRSFGDAKQSRMFKAANFDYCTFSGTFTSRTDKALINHSGLLCIDFDHLQNLDSLRSQLLQDEYFDTQLLFRSPSGDGLKWVIEIDISQTPHADYFRAVANYLFQTYGVEADKSGKDISRACFLPYD